MFQIEQDGYVPFGKKGLRQKFQIEQDLFQKKSKLKFDFSGFVI